MFLGDFVGYGRTNLYCMIKYDKNQVHTFERVYFILFGYDVI